MLMRRNGDAFAIAWDPKTMPHTIRWILANSDQRVAAFAMPATCEPEGYTAEKRKGNVRSLAGGAKARFSTIVRIFRRCARRSRLQAVSRAVGHERAA